MCGLWKPGGTWPGGKIMAGDWFDSGILPAAFTTCVTVFAESSGTTNAEAKSRQGRLEHGGRAGAVDVYLCATSVSAAYCGWVLYATSRNVGFGRNLDSKAGNPGLECLWLETMHPFGQLLPCIYVGHLLNAVSGVAASQSCANAESETIGKEMASA